MTNRMNNYLTTGEFAKLCRVNKRTLFHYDDIGLFQPVITDENGYRYYSFDQLDIFSIISILKELKVPLTEIKKYLDERTPEKLLQFSSQKIEEIDQKIRELNLARHLLNETIALTNKGLHVNYEEIAIEEQEEECLIRSELLTEKNTEDYPGWIWEFNNFENRTLSEETSFVSTMLSIESITKGNYYNHSYFFVKTKDKSLSNAVKPKGSYVVAYHHGSLDTIGETYDRLTNYCDQNRLQMSEFSYEESLLDIVAMKNENDYIMQITVAVEKI